MRLYELYDSVLKNGTKQTLYNVKYTWDAQRGRWMDPRGVQAGGAASAELMKAVGKDPSGRPLSKSGGVLGMAQRAIDSRIGGSLGGGIDPKATVLGKAMGHVGAAIGRGLAKAIAPKKVAANTPIAPAKPNTAGAQGANGAGKPGAPAQAKPVTNIMQPELKALQSRTLAGDINAAKQLVNQLSDLKTKGFDVDNFIQAAVPAMKRGGLAKSDPQAYAHFTKLARSMRSEAYEHLSKVLEAAGFTWEDVGYKVLVSESITDYVMLMPVHDINVYEMKKLAGI